MRLQATDDVLVALGVVTTPAFCERRAFLRDHYNALSSGMRALIVHRFVVGSIAIMRGGANRSSEVARCTRWTAPRAGEVGEPTGSPNTPACFHQIRPTACSI